MDEPPQGRISTLLAGPRLDMAHELSGALKQTIGIVKIGATKGPDIDMNFEGIDVAECCIPHARDRIAVMQQLSDVVSGSSMKP